MNEKGMREMTFLDGTLNVCVSTKMASGVQRFGRGGPLEHSDAKSTEKKYGKTVAKHIQHGKEFLRWSEKALVKHENIFTTILISSKTSATHAHRPC